LGTVFLNKNKILPFHPPLEGERHALIPNNKILPLNPHPKGENFNPPLIKIQSLILILRIKQFVRPESIVLILYYKSDSFF